MRCRNLLPVGHDGGLLGVLPHLAGHERTPPGAARLRTPHPYLGAVQTQLNTLRGGVGEDIGQRVQTQSRLAGDREAPRRQERQNIIDGPRDGGASTP